MPHARLLALDRLADTHNLQSLAYYYKGSGVPANEDTMSSIILGTSLLTARGIPVAGEYEVKNALAMKIMDSLGAGGSFTEYYALDFKAGSRPDGATTGPATSPSPRTRQRLGRSRSITGRWGAASPWR